MLITFCVVAYNEEKAMPVLLDNLMNQTYPHEQIEVILVDGMSTDKTKEICLDFKEKHSSEFNRILVLDNPGKLLACGFNVALKEFIGEALVRVDAHAMIPNDFIEMNVTVLKEGHDIVGGTVSNFVRNESSWTKVVNAAENSMFGGSIAAFRHVDSARVVDTLAFGMYRAEVFHKTGFYNENLARTEDNDMHYRMRQNGYQFYYDPRIRSTRETRPSFLKLLKQKTLNGYWIGLTMGVSPKCFGIYHFVPFAFVLAIVIMTILVLFSIEQLSALMWILYGIAILLMTILAYAADGLKTVKGLALPLCFFALNLGYGVGTLVGLIKMPVWRKKIKKEN